MGFFGCFVHLRNWSLFTHLVVWEILQHCFTAKLQQSFVDYKPKTDLHFWVNYPFNTQASLMQPLERAMLCKVCLTKLKYFGNPKETYFHPELEEKQSVADANNQKTIK